MLLFLTLFCSRVSNEWRAVIVSDHLSQLKVRSFSAEGQVSCVTHSSLRGRVCLLRGSAAPRANRATWWSTSQAGAVGGQREGSVRA